MLKYAVVDHLPGKGWGSPVFFDRAWDARRAASKTASRPPSTENDFVYGCIGVGTPWVPTNIVDEE